MSSLFWRLDSLDLYLIKEKRTAAKRRFLSSPAVTFREEPARARVCVAVGGPGQDTNKHHMSLSYFSKETQKEKRGARREERTAGTCHAHGDRHYYLGDDKDSLDGLGHLCRQPLSWHPPPGSAHSRWKQPSFGVSRLIRATGFVFFSWKWLKK